MSKNTIAHPALAPGFVAPMKARETSTVPAGDEWIYEIKWDGYRAIIVKDGTNVQIWSQNEKQLTADYPSVLAAVRELPVETAVLDGEIVAVNEKGRSSFERLQERASVPRDQIVLYAFDLLLLDGADLRDFPLMERKQRLAALVAGTDVRFSPGFDWPVEKILREFKTLDLEGVVAKRRHSFYEAGARSEAWQKFHLKIRQEFVVGGFRPGRPVDSIVVGYYDDDGRLISAGKVRQKLDPHRRAELARALDPLVIPGCPFVNLPDAKKSRDDTGVTPEDMKRYRWVKPETVVEVGFKHWTKEGRLHEADFLGIRPDKDPRDVHREIPAVAKPGGLKIQRHGSVTTASHRARGRKTRLSSPRRHAGKHAAGRTRNVRRGRNHSAVKSRKSRRR